MKIYAYLLLLSTILLSNCNMYELNTDEEFKIIKIADRNFLAVYSKDFKISFLLQCRKNTQIYDKVEQSSSAKDKNSFLIVDTLSDIEKIKISFQKYNDSIKHIKFSIENKVLTTVKKQNTLFISTNANNEDAQYVPRDLIVQKPSLPLGFECDEDYFANEYKTSAVSFKDAKIEVNNIINGIRKLKTQSKDYDNAKLILFYTNCKKWINIQKNNNLEDLYVLDKQILSQEGVLHKNTENLLVELQQSGLQNYEISPQVVEEFTTSMNALKTSEKIKSGHFIFKNIYNIFYIRYNKDFRDKLNYILTSNQSTYYYNLLSNTQAGSFIDESNFKIPIVPIKITIYALDRGKNFLAIQVKSTIDINNQNTQFTAYKLSNSFCTYLDRGIKNSNQLLTNKIQLVDYCYAKEFSNTYTPPKRFVQQTSQNNTSYQNNYQEESVQEEYTQETQNNTQSKSGTCSTQDNIKICTDISKNSIKSKMTDGFTFPTLDKLQNDFDTEEYEGVTIYAQDSKYFFFDEDEGWSSIDELFDDIPVDLILVR